MEGGPEKVEAAELVDDAVARAIVVTFGLEGAEQAIPDDEHPGIVAIEVARVGGVVDAVVRGRVHHRLEPARHPPDYLGVNPELVDEVQAGDEEHHRGRKADQEQGQAEEEGEAEEAGPRLSQRGGEVIMLGAVVDDMARPEPADAMRGAVEGVIGQIVDDEGDDEPIPGIANIEEAELV